MVGPVSLFREQQSPGLSPDKHEPSEDVSPCHALLDRRNDRPEQRECEYQEHRDRQIGRIITCNEERCEHNTARVLIAPVERDDELQDHHEQ